MNTIEEISETSEMQEAEEMNGLNSSLMKTKIISTTTSTSSSANGKTHAAPHPPTANNVNGAASTTTSNATTSQQSSSSSADYLEDLKIIGHLKNIEKLNETRRVFLSNTITSSAEYSSDEKTISGQASGPQNGDANDCYTSSSSSTAATTLLHEQQQQKQQQSNVERVPLSIALNKYATLPLKTPRTPITPPPKPPMLSRTRSIGIGDSRSMSSPPVSPKLAPPPPPPAYTTTATPTPRQVLLDTKTSTTTNILVQPTESTMVTSSNIAEEPIDGDNKPQDAVILRSSLAIQNINGEIDCVAGGFAPDAALKDIPVKHYERLIEELKCPGCAFPMKSPIYLCRTGHSVCDQCTRILMLCPLCKEGYTNIRSLTVEALCSKAHFKCSNASGGCTVRLQTDLLSWHEKQCIYKPMKCFMGRVWGDCQWNGREAFWKDHLEAEHANKVFTRDSVDLIWNMGVKQKPLTGYYVFQVFNEMFNFYEIYDKDRILFTMTCTSTQKEKKHQFAYEVTLVNEDIEALSQTQKFPVHSEYDSDILAEGTCVSINISDLAKFLDEERLLHYRVRVLEVKTPRKSKIFGSCNIAMIGGKLPIDFKQTNIEGVNLKNVPSDVILTRRLDNIPYADNESPNASSIFASSEDEMEKYKREYYQKLEAKKKAGDDGSDSDPEFEAFLARKWGTPQLNFNRKYLKNTASPSDSSSSTDDSPKSPKTLNDDKVSLTSTSYKKRMSTTLRKSFRSLKSDLIEMKPFGKKSSPEKK